MTNRQIKVFYIFIVICSAFFYRCSSDNLAGGGTEDVNTRVVTGKVFNPDGLAASQAQVQLIPANHDPVRDSNLVLLKDTTNDNGEYCFVLTETGEYNAQIVEINTRTRAMTPNENVHFDTTVFPSVVLEKPGNIKVPLSEHTTTDNGYIYIPGTTIYSLLKSDSAHVILDSVPVNTLSDIVYSTATDVTEKTVLRFNVLVKSNETTIVSNPGWAYCRTLILNTSSTGADVAGTVTNFPILVRLTDNNFEFNQAQKNGDDILFSKQNDIFLAHEIEEWDESKKRAFIWVKVDTVKGNNSEQSILMYWGNKDAPASSRSTAVFDTASGFQGVWHMGQDGNTTIFDATANHFDGTPSGMNAQSLVEGMIGGAQRFDGVSSYISLSGTADSKLDFPQNSNYTLSAWVYTEKIDTTDTTTQYIISKSNRSYNLLLSGYRKWEIYDVEDGIGLQSIYVEPTEKEWKLLTGVCKGDDMRLYVDGVCMDSIREIVSGVPHDGSFDVQIGKRSDSDYGYWFGMIDEVRLMNVALSADWIKLSFMNQRKDDKLIVFEE
jgi:hypothetical protein